MIAMSGVPSRVREGMLVLSGDVLLLFNPLQIDSFFEGAAAISIKEDVTTGKDHRVFLNDGNGYVKSFLHKKSEEKLREIGAVNEHNAVDLDTGAILLNVEIIEALYRLISTDGQIDNEKFDLFVNEQARVSFYSDIIYPLTLDSNLAQYYKEKAEGEFTKELYECRTKLWNVLRRFKLKLFCLSPAQFIHLGTTRELRQFISEEISDYEFLDWSNQIAPTRMKDVGYSSYGSYIGHKVRVCSNAYVEESYVLDESEIGQGSIVSYIKMRGLKVPDNIVLHGLPVRNEKYVVRIYGVSDNPKGNLVDDVPYMNTTLKKFSDEMCCRDIELWDKDKPCDIWNAKLFPVCDTSEEALKWALSLYEITSGRYELADEWGKQDRISLCESFHIADMDKISEWHEELECRILCRKFIDCLDSGMYYKEALNVFGIWGMTEKIYRMLLKDAKIADFRLQIRIYYAISRYMKENRLCFDGLAYDYTEALCFETIQNTIYDIAMNKLPDSSTYRICRNMLEVQLPVRVNWGGGWTDTPPYCNENGGVVLNAAISLNGILPVQIVVKCLEDLHIEFESQDIGVRTSIYTAEEIQNCHNPYDSFALHKAALIACGIIPMREKADLQSILKKIGGGIYLSTQVVGIPKGSGLGTSSILAGACVKGIFEFLGCEKTNEEVYDIVLCMEQIMSTGGGWQDQVGGLTNGIKFITTKPGLDQNIKVEQVKVPDDAMNELQERFAVIYTGQRRLARNLLRDVVGGYIGSRPESREALGKMESVAALMRFYLERGEIDRFAELMNEHWELSKQLDEGSTNTCINQIFAACEDLIDGKFIAGAGGGGFLMVILKKGVSKDLLKERLDVIFQNSGVGVWDSQFV